MPETARTARDLPVRPRQVARHESADGLQDGLIDWSRNLDLVRVLALDDDGTYMQDSGDARLPEVWELAFGLRLRQAS